MRIGIPAERDPHETRAAASPASVKKLVGLGATVVVEAGLGSRCQWSDAEFSEAGASLSSDRQEILSNSDLLLQVRPPAASDLAAMARGTICISYLDPFNSSELVEQAAAAGVSAISLEMIPRTTLAQKMDALSSQHSLAGYYMVILAAERLAKILPMMTTPAGTIQPSRVFVIGAGVAGLQAIATAKRLGARVDAFDTRPEVEEQVKSLGGRFVKIDLGETGSTNQGYATQLSEDQLAKQREGMRQQCAVSDIVITTAQLFGRKAPVVITKEMLSSMRPGSVVVDYAVESGGNVEGSRPGEEVDIDGVKVIGLRNYPGQVAQSASQMLANNFANMIQHFWDKESKAMALRREDEILAGCLVTHGGEIVNPVIRKHYGLPELAAAAKPEGASA
ncbi:MAG: NAD(P) transhydrogenase subunit alpha [Planctomycetota bacterium]|nr:MAG: NAD(P) transhydrogenase subunit alpha [Planctomycetota bacterium]